MSYEDQVPQWARAMTLADLLAFLDPEIGSDFDDWEKVSEVLLPILAYAAGLYDDYDDFAREYALRLACFLVKNDGEDLDEAKAKKVVAHLAGVADGVLEQAPAITAATRDRLAQIKNASPAFEAAE